MRQKLIFAIVPLCLNILLLFSACGQKYYRYQVEFADVFDTESTIIGYTKSQMEFTRYSEIIREELKRMHKLYDIYNDYDNLNNLKTVNDRAGIAPVKVDGDIIDMLEFSAEAYGNTDGVVNIAMGPVLKLWHDCRTASSANMDSAKLPAMESLKEAALNTDINGLVIDRQNGTVFLKKRGMRLDVGAIAKGYAVEKAVDAAKEKGMESALVNIGGNIVAVGKPLDNLRSRWSVGIQDPQTGGIISNIADTIYVSDSAVVTSGSYQRFYIVDGKSYSHIIDPFTLIPAERYASVTVLHESSAVADMLSTAVFILTEEKGEKLLEVYGAQAVWIYFDGSMKATDGYSAISKELGNYSPTD